MSSSFQRLSCSGRATCHARSPPALPPRSAAVLRRALSLASASRFLARDALFRVRRAGVASLGRAARSPRASATVRPSSAARRARRARPGASPRLARPRAFLDRFRLPSPALPGKRPSLPTLTGADVVPGQGKGAPAWSEMHDALNALGVRGVDARDLPALVARPDVLLLDVRQTLEHEEWRLVDSANVPYAIPDPNVARRVVGYAVSIKGGLKVRNPAFVDAGRARRSNPPKPKRRSRSTGSS